MPQQVRQTGVELTSGLTQLQQKFPSQISNARGAGSMQAIDARNAQHRDQLLLALKNIGKFSRLDIYFAKCKKVSYVISSFFDVVLGVNAGANGERTMRLRNTLVFGSKHAEVFLDRFEEVLKQTE